MTDIQRGRGGPGGPPWSVDLLADLQAGALDPAQTAELWPRVNTDPEAQAVLAALDATQVDLREFAMAPAAPMPAHFAARLDTAIATESAARSQTHAPPASPAPVINLDEARKRRNRRLGWAGGILTAAAAAAAIAFAAIPGGGSGDIGVAHPTPGAVEPSGPLAFKSGELGRQQLDAAKGSKDFGPLADKQKLSQCLEANGRSGKAEPLGARQVKVDGKPGIVLVLVHGAGEFTLLVVGPDCGPGNPAKLAEKTV